MQLTVYIHMKHASHEKTHQPLQTTTPKIMKIPKDLSGAEFRGRLMQNFLRNLNWKQGKRVLLQLRIDLWSAGSRFEREQSNAIDGVLQWGLECSS